MDILTRIVDYVGGALSFQVLFLRLGTNDERGRFLRFRLKEADISESDIFGGCDGQIDSLERQINDLNTSPTISISSLIADPFLGQNEPVTFWVSGFLSEQSQHIFWHITCSECKKIVPRHLWKDTYCSNCSQNVVPNIGCALSFEVSKGTSKTRLLRSRNKVRKFLE